jgi:hypothetical protein
MNVLSLAIELLHADGQAGMTKLVIAFRNFTNIPNELIFCRYSVAM